MKDRATDEDPAIYHEVAFRSRVARDGSSEWLAVDNVAWCGSARCPRCAPHVASKLSARVSSVLAGVDAVGAGCAYGTFTVSHGPNTPLLAMREVLGSSWRALQRGGLWRRLRREGLIGVVRNCDETWGPATGWHPHIHALVIHRDGLEAAVAAGRDLVRRWLHLLDAAGWRASEAGQDVRPVTRDAGLGDYGTKMLRGWGMAAEMAAGWRKSGRRPDRMTLPQLLAFGLAGDREAMGRYLEAVVALRGRRLLVIGPSVKRALGIEAVPDLVDGEELDPVEGDGQLVGTMSGYAWVVGCDRQLSAWVVRQVKNRHRTESWATLRRDLERLLLYGPDPPDG